MYIFKFIHPNNKSLMTNMTLCFILYIIIKWQRKYMNFQYTHIIYHNLFKKL